MTLFPEPQVRAVSASVAKVAPEFFGRESVEMANLGRESLNIPNKGRAVLVAPPRLRSLKSRRIILDANDSLEKPHYGAKLCTG